MQYLRTFHCSHGVLVAVTAQTKGWTGGGGGGGRRTDFLWGVLVSLLLVSLLLGCVAVGGVCVGGGGGGGQVVCVCGGCLCGCVCNILKCSSNIG